MLSFFRRVSKSKVGTGIMAMVLIAILAGFAVADLSNFGSGNINLGMGSGTLAKVGDQSINERDVSDAMQRRLQDARQQRPDADYATIIGDLADPATLPTDRFDCVILTQTLQYVFDVEAAVANIRRSLREGGVALISVPALSPLFEDEWKASHYWLFTSLALERLLAAQFDRNKISVAAHGNLYAATAFLHGAAVEEVRSNKLRKTDSSYPVTITARAVA